MAHGVHHPIFARFYVRMSGQMEAGVGEYRDELLAGLRGRVVEVGCGNGLNFAHYPDTVGEVVGVEPERYLRERAEAAAGNARIPITVVDGTGEHLPFPDASFDAGVASLVLCTVPDQAVALAELHRVIRAGGELRFLEHVLSERPRHARVQRAVDRTVGPFLTGGCHAARDTLSAIGAAGFEVEHHRAFSFPPKPTLPTSPHVVGVARRV